MPTPVGVDVGILVEGDVVGSEVDIKAVGTLDGTSEGDDDSDGDIDVEGLYGAARGLRSGEVDHGGTHHDHRTGHQWSGGVADVPGCIAFLAEQFDPAVAAEIRAGRSVPGVDGHRALSASTRGNSVCPASAAC